MKASMVAASVALVGSVAASQHKAHAGYHLRRGDYQADGVCTVYTTVYATAMPSIVPNSTAIAHFSSAPGTSTSCDEDKKTSIYTPVVVSSTKEAPKPSKEAYTPAPPAPNSESSEAVYTPAYTPVPVPSKPAEYSPVSASSKPAEYSPVPASSKPAEHSPVPTSSKPAEYSPVSVFSKPAEYSPVPASSKPAAYPAVPASSKAAEKPKPTGGYSSGGRIVTNGDKWAITYTPYANSGDCKTGDDIKADIQKISEMGFTTIRSYSTDCGVFEYVIPACQKYGLKVIYGIFLEAGGKGPFSDYANQQLSDIKKNAPKDSVAMVIVGSECIFNNNCEASQLGSYIDYVRKELQGSGFPSDIAVTTTEPVGTWQEKGAALCDHIDVFAAQVHPYFTASVTAEEAGVFASQQLELAAKVCPSAAAKGKYITEIGWPSAGDANGKAVAGKEQQKIAMKTIVDTVGAEACLFSFQNDGWKHPGDLNVEQNFGCVDALI